MQSVVDSVGLRRVCAPVGKDIHIFCNRHIKRRICRLVTGTHIKPATEGIRKPADCIAWVIHTSQHTAVRYFPCFKHTAFIACCFKGNHIVIGAEEAYRVIYGRPLSVQTDILPGHCVSGFIFTAVIASRRIIPTAEGICVFLQSRRIRRRGIAVIVQRILIWELFIQMDLIIIMHSQIMIGSLIEKPCRIGMSSVGKIGVFKRGLSVCGEAVESRLCLMFNTCIVVRGVNGLIEKIIHTVIGKIAGFPGKHRNVHFVLPLERITPTDISSVFKKGEKRNYVRGSFRGVIQKMLVKLLKHTLNG